MRNTANDTRATAERILRAANVVISDQHFVYISGDHGSGWINKDVLYLDPKHVSQLALLLSELLVDVEADIVCGPATGGLVISQWLAFHMNLQSVFAEHEETSVAGDHSIRPPFVLRRHYDKVVQNKRVIVVDDIINTGHSIKQTIDAVKSAGGKVVCATTLCDRGNVDGTTLGADKFVALTEIKVSTWPEEGCALCLKGVPINEDYAHGHEYVERLKLAHATK